MTLSEKLYNLRRKQGLSQEVVAEKLDCSRQAISKWENGTTTPDAKMLKKYSELFGVSIDYLIKEEIQESSSTNSVKKDIQNKKLISVLGFILSLIGCLSLILFGVITIFNSDTGDKIAQSSMIVINGTYIAMLISVLFVVFGAIMLIKTMKHK
jgi:transcriptional regulator with XRE-family HTH domain